MVDVSLMLVLAAAIISIGFFANLFFSKTRIPDILWLILVGILIGPIFNIVSQETLLSFSPLFAAIAIMIILFDSGLGMDIYKMMGTALHATILTIINFALAAFFVMVPSVVLFGVSPINALMLGVIVSGTSSAMVVTVVQKLTGLGKNVRDMLGLESILNDPLVIVIAIVLMQSQISGNGLSAGFITTSILGSFAVSILIGLAIGIFWSHLLTRLREFEYHHMLTLALLFFSYPLSETLGGSGAITSLIIGIVLGNSRRFKRFFKKIDLVGLTSRTKEFNSYLSFFVRTFFFVFLGAIVTLKRLDMIGIGIALTLFLVAGRYVATRLISRLIGLEKRDILTITFMCSKGLAAAVVASLPFVQYKIPGTEGFTDIVFTIIVASSVISTAGIGYLENLYNEKPRKKK